MRETWYLGQATAVQVEGRGERGVAAVGQRRDNQAADVAKVLVAVETGRVGLSHLVRVRVRARVRDGVRVRARARARDRVRVRLALAH